MDSTTKFTLPQAEIRRRLHDAQEGGKAKKGRNPKAHAHELRLGDIAEYTGLGRYVTMQLAEGKRDMSPTEQIKLSNFLIAYEQGKLIKRKAGNKWFIMRADGKPHPAKTGLQWGVEVGINGPQLKRMPPE